MGGRGDRKQSIFTTHIFSNLMLSRWHLILEGKNYNPIWCASKCMYRFINKESKERWSSNTSLSNKIMTQGKINYVQSLYTQQLLIMLCNESINKNSHTGWRVSQMVTNTNCSSRGSRLESQQPYGGLHPFITLGPGDSLPSSGLLRFCIHSAQILI